MSVAIGQRLGLSDNETEELRWAALLHDIGKVGIDTTVQFKIGELTQNEYQYILGHCSIGSGIVESLVNESIVEIIKHHHDHYDGNMPNQTLYREEIPLGSRIIAVADAFDAMTSDRPYRTAMSRDKAIAEIKRYNSTQFDPQVVKAFLETLFSTRQSESLLDIT